MAIEKRQSDTSSVMRHFMMTRRDLRERVLRLSLVWGIMTSLFPTHLNNEKGRAQVLAIAQIDYYKYFDSYERLLLKKTSQATREGYEVYITKDGNS